MIHGTVKVMEIDITNWGDPRRLALALQQATALEAELEGERKRKEKAVWNTLPPSWGNSDREIIQAIAWQFHGVDYYDLEGLAKDTVDKLLAVGDLLKEEKQLLVPWCYSKDD